MPWAIAAIGAFLFLRLKPQPAQAVAASASVPSISSGLGMIAMVPSASAQPGPPNVIGQQAAGLAEKTGIGLATSTGGAALGVGSATVTGALATGLETAGIGAALFFGTEMVTDLFKCGTIGQRGCQKRDDTKTQITGISAMKRVMYAVEIGQATVQQAAALIQSISQQVYAAYENKASGNHFGMDVRGSDAGIPDNSLSALYMLGQQTSLAAMTQAFIAYLPTLAAAHANGTAPVPQAYVPLAVAGGAGASAGNYDPIHLVLQ